MAPTYKTNRLPSGRALAAGTLTYLGAVEILAALRLGTHLNAVRHGLVSVEVAARAVVGSDTAHHVSDPHGLLGLDRDHATALETAMAAIGLFVDDDWVVLLPRAGAPSGLRGPALAAAIDAGAATAPVGGGPVLVPIPVGRAVQWLALPGERLGPLPDPGEAEPALSQAVLAATAALAELDVPAGRPTGRAPVRADADDVLVAPGYPVRQRQRAVRAAHLLTACSTVLATTPDFSQPDAEAHRRVLRQVRDAAADALTAATRWPG